MLRSIGEELLLKTGTPKPNNPTVITHATVPKFAEKNAIVNARAAVAKMPAANGYEQRVTDHI